MPTDRDSQREALQRFIVGNNDLLSLEALAKRFNFFEALGAVRDECRHSHFLGFLLDPEGSHGLGDRFLKRALQLAAETEPTISPLTPVDIELLDFSEARVQVEYSDIDVFIRDERNRISVILENKVDSDEHSNQLSRYYRLITQRYRDDRVFGIYLTIDGEPPEKAEDCEHYVPMSHSGIKSLLDKIRCEPGIRFDDDVSFAIRQYADVLGRHFMADDEIKALCGKIYRQHKQAIDLIISNLPNQRMAVREKILDLIKSSDTLIPDDSTTKYVRFIPKALDIQFFGGGSGWTSSKRMLLFEFQISLTSVILVLQLGPGDQKRRKAIHDFARAEGGPFSPEATFYGKWQTLYRKRILEKFDAASDRDQLLVKLDAKWKEFLEDDLPVVEKRLLEHNWSAS